MPELPEVEIYTRIFAKHGLRKSVADVRVLDARILGDIRAERFVAQLKGSKFRHVRRHGKHLFADAGTTWLHLHFGMSGDLIPYRGGADPRFARVVFDFTNGEHLAFDDMRLFGVVDTTPDPDVFIAEHKLGPDPLDPAFKLRDFRRLLGRRRGAIKSLLMSQDILAGIGNLYADETLFQTSIHPRRAVDRISAAEARSIFTTMRRILRDVIARRENDRELPHRYLFVHREEGERCRRCGGTIKRTVVFGRTTYFCGTHQL